MRFGAYLGKYNLIPIRISHIKAVSPRIPLVEILMITNQGY